MLRLTGAVFVVDTSVVASWTIGADSESPPAPNLNAMLDGLLCYLVSGALFDECSTFCAVPESCVCADVPKARSGAADLAGSVSTN